jgi:hypothetical protein
MSAFTLVSSAIPLGADSQDDGAYSLFVTRSRLKPIPTRWSLTAPPRKLVIIGAKVVRCRYLTLRFGLDRHPWNATTLFRDKPIGLEPEEVELDYATEAAARDLSFN